MKKILIQILNTTLFISLSSTIAFVPKALAQANFEFNEKENVTRNNCNFSNLDLPEDFTVYATGGYSGRELSYQIDRSGHTATQIDVIANSPSKPVILMLGAYESTIWNIQWTEETKIVGVLASGYHRQAVAGLPNETPLKINTYNNGGKCEYFYLTPDNYNVLNPLSRQLFGQEVEKIFLLDDSTAIVGNPLADSSKLITSKDTPVKSFFDRTAPLAGQAGIEEALKKGILRRATKEDAEAWVEKERKSKPEQDIPPIEGGDEYTTYDIPSYANAYVVLEEFTYPSGLYGGHSVIFFIPEGVPRPLGNPGHSGVYDFNTLKCTGARC